MDQLLLGRAYAIFAGGSYVPLAWGVIKGCEALRVVAPDTFRPFSADRQGRVPSGGTGMVELKSPEHAMRVAQPY